MTRGQCRRCARQYLIRADGMIRSHDQPTIRFPNGRTLRGPTCPGSGLPPAVPPIICTGQAFDADGRAVGPPCGKSIGTVGQWWTAWPADIAPGSAERETAEQLATRARLSGWKIASDGTGNAMCPTCSKPSADLVKLCRDLNRSVKRG